MRTVELVSDTQTIKFGDTATELNLKVLNGGKLVNLDGKDTAQVKIRSDTGFIRSSDETLVDVVEDVVTFKSAIFSGLAPGKYYLEVWLTQTDKGTLVYPDNGFVSLMITSNAENIADGVITTLTLEEFKKQFDELYQDTQLKMDSISSESEKLITAIDDATKDSVTATNAANVATKNATNAVVEVKKIGDQYSADVVQLKQDLAKKVSQVDYDTNQETILSALNGKQSVLSDTGWQTLGVTLLNGAQTYSGDSNVTPRYRIIDFGFAKKVILAGALQNAKKDTAVVSYPELPKMDTYVTKDFLMPSSGNNYVRWTFDPDKFTLNDYTSSLDDAKWSAGTWGTGFIWFPFYFEYWSTKMGV